MDEASKSNLKFSAREKNTYHDNGEADAKQTSVKGKHPGIIMRLHDPTGERNTHRDFLPTIWVAIFLIVFPDGLVSKPGTRLEQANSDTVLLHTLYRPS